MVLVAFELDWLCELGGFVGGAVLGIAQILSQGDSKNVKILEQNGKNFKDPGVYCRGR